LQAASTSNRPQLLRRPSLRGRHCDNFLDIHGLARAKPENKLLTRHELLIRSASSFTTIMAALGDDLLATVNKLQDLVFNTIGNDSLDLPQIVRSRYQLAPPALYQ